MTSNAPTAARLRHVEAIEAPRVDAATFRQGWRVRTRLDALERDGRITPGEWQAAVEYRDAWARLPGAGGGSYAGLLRVSGGYDTHSRLLGRIDTITRLSVVEAAIGRFASSLCYRCAVEDRSWASSAASLHCNPETIRDWTVEALRELAWAWAGGRFYGADAYGRRLHQRRRARVF